MADEDAPPLTLHPSAPPNESGAEDLFEFVDQPPDPAEAEARDVYLAECADPPEAGSEIVKASSTAVQPGASDPDKRDEQNRQVEHDEIRTLKEGIGPHLEELRRRLIISAAIFIPAFAVGLYLYRALWDFLLLPLAEASPHLLHFQALSPSDGLILSMRIAFAFALLITTPIWISQIWGFIAPGLTGGEQRWLYLALGSGVVLFLVGVLVAYFQAVPLALSFLLPLNQSLTGWENSFTGAGYVDFVVTCCIAFGIAFELPLVMMLLGWVGLLTPEGIKSWWRVVVIGVFVLAAVMTPPDPFSQLLLAIPMLGLFFLGYFLVKWTNRKQ